MKMLGMAGLLLSTTLLAADLSGRWEGSAQIPGAAQPMVIDLAGPLGSITLPGRGVSGAPLREISFDADGLRASLAAAMPHAGQAGPPPMIELAITPDGRLAGRFMLAGLSAPLLLQRTGPAQVQTAPTSTTISPALAGVWRGRYELAGSPREVTLTLKAGPPGPRQAELLIVGKRANEVPVDRVSQGPLFLSLESSEYALSIEGRIDGNRIEATLQQGAVEVNFVLTRGAGS